MELYKYGKQNIKNKSSVSRIQYSLTDLLLNLRASRMLIYELLKDDARVTRH